jgi:hypothetical protein
MNDKSVLDKPSYDFIYTGNTRFFSYAHQLSNIIANRPESILEIGVGNRIVSHNLQLLNLAVTTPDIDVRLKPNIVGNVMNIPIKDNSFDLISCCQVLEHLPFGCFRVALMELFRVSKRVLILSLPDQDRYIELSLRLPKIGLRRLSLSLPRLRPQPILQGRFEEMGHYWEIGYKGFPLDRVKEIIKHSGWKIIRTWRVSEIPWHRFFLLVK